MLPLEVSLVSEPDRIVRFIRHGSRQDFVDPEWCSRSDRPHDPPLSQEGVEQARQTARHLAGLRRPKHLLVSPFLRTLETAAPIAAELGLKMKVEPGLAECLYTAWFPTEPDYLAAAQLAMKDVIDAGHQRLITLEYPEDKNASHARGASVMGAMLAQFPGDLLLVTHGGILDALARALVPKAVVTANLCCIVEIHFNRGKGWSLERNGADTSHLSAVPGLIRLH